jgi:hypothetical protein
MRANVARIEGFRSRLKKRQNEHSEAAAAAEAAWENHQVFHCGNRLFMIIFGCFDAVLPHTLSCYDSLLPHTLIFNLLGGNTCGRRP